MNIEQRLLEEEGICLSCYTDTLGNPTIGVGHLLKSPCDDITLEYAGKLLAEDIKETTRLLLAKIPCFGELDEERKYVLISMSFNLGINGVLGFKNMLKALESRNYTLASQEMLNSKWALQVKRRAKKLSECMRTGYYK